MLSSEDSRQALRRLFRQRRIADLALVSAALQTGSRRSVFRRLSLLEYVRSYSHTGRYYTLEDVPEFDANGLWQWQGVFFSRHGTLRATAAHLVEAAEDGRTHRELETVLRVRVHNTLLDLVRGKRIGREVMGGLFLYVSAAPERAGAQIARRRQRVAAVVQATSVAGEPLEIVVLLEVIHGARLIPGPAEIAERLASRGVQVSREQVESLFHKHGLKKTPGPRSRSSKR